MAASASHASYITGSQHVTGFLYTSAYTVSGTTYGPFGLNYSYQRSFDGTQLSNHVEINFAFNPNLGYSDADKARYRSAAIASVEGIWNNRFFIVDDVGGARFPLTVALTTTGPFDQTVSVHRGPGRADALNWYTDSTAPTMAHEFGHLLGLFDEYIGGAIDRYPDPTLSATGLMGSGALFRSPDMLPRYYQSYVDYITALNPGPQRAFRLTPVPLPSTALLVLIGAYALLRVPRERHHAARGLPAA